MKKTTNKLAKAMATALVATTAFGAAACGNPFATDLGGDQDLQILLLYKGYQDEWLTAVKNLFVKEDWVKAKYPSVNVTVDNTDVDALPVNKLNGGASMNQYDLIFSVNLKGYEGGGITADLTDSVYLTEVPGEPGVKVKDKIPETILNYAKGNANRIKEREDGESSYYCVNYINGMSGILYNADHLAAMNKEVPRTTIEFRNLCKYIETNGYTYKIDQTTNDTSKCAIMVSNETGYWASAFPAWWAQYEGMENFENFYKGVYNGERSNRVLTQTGRLRSLEELEYIFRGEDGKGGYGYDYAGAVDYKVSQTDFLSGKGVFHFNGDYFAAEMHNETEGLKRFGIDYNIRYMKFPVISSIVEKLELYADKGTDYTDLSDAKKAEYDVVLSAIIADIDNNLTYEESTVKATVSKKDFNKVAEARCIAAATAGLAQTAVVPSYATAKDLACDFLRFMYTDKAIKAFAKASEGTMFSVKYEYMADTELYNSFNRISQSKVEIFAGSSNYSFTTMPTAQCFPLGVAGLTGMSSLSSSYEALFSVTSGIITTAEDLYKKDIAYWNDMTWNQMLARAGLSS